MENNRSFNGFSLFVAIVASIGGLLFGYNTSVVSGALLFITQEIPLTIVQKEVVVSTLLLGALIGAFFGGILSDKLGRRFTLFFSTFLFVIGIAFLYRAQAVHGLIIGRFIVGLAVGIVSLAVPLYIAEMAPAKFRGMFVSFNQLAVTIGILVAYGVDYGFSSSGNWRAMFGISFIFAALFFVGLIFIPSTPSWLATQGRMKKAKEVLSKIHGREEEEALIETKKEKPGKLSSWSHLKDKTMHLALFVGIGLSVFQQISGINIVIYYAPIIFRLAKFQTVTAAIFASLGLGIINVIMTIIALWIIDRVGRRVLLIIGFCGMTICLTILSISFFLGSQDIGIICVVSLMAYIAFFAISLGPVVWLIISEIFSMGIRGRAMGIATFFNWVFNYIVSVTFLSLLAAIGKGWTFLLYAIIGLIGLFFTIKFVPETKGKSLEEIQRFWRKKVKKS